MQSLFELIYRLWNCAVVQLQSLFSILIVIEKNQISVKHACTFFIKKMWRFIDFCVRLWIFRSSIWSSREKTKNKMNNIKVSLRNNLFSPVKINSKASNIFDEIIHTVAVICWFGLVWFGRDVEKCVHICIYHGDAFFLTA